MQEDGSMGGESLSSWYQLRVPGSSPNLDLCSWDCVREFAAAHPDESTLLERR